MFATRARAALVAGVALVAVTPSTSRGDAGSDAAPEVRDANLDAADLGPIDPKLAQLSLNAERVRALIGESLGVAIAPRSLFDVDLADGAVVDLEAARLRALLRRAEQKPDPLDKKDSKKAIALADAATDTAPDSVSPEIDPVLWAARLDLDRARLSFYQLPESRRAELLASHAKRQLAAAPPPTEEQLLAQKTEAERLRALEAARDARTEAARLVSEEYARLLQIEAGQLSFKQSLAARRLAIAARQEATLGWQRRTREARGSNAPAEVDRLYDALRVDLREARTQLDHALDELATREQGSPSAGANPLAALPATVDARDAVAARARIDAAERKLNEEQSAIRDDRAAQLLVEIDVLNRERLWLLPFLSPGKGDAVTGFGTAGFEQAGSELKQLSLVFRYHRQVVGRWLSARGGRNLLGDGLGTAMLVLLEWSAAIALFLWIRRRVPGVLQRAHEQSVEDDHQERRVSPSIATRAFRFALDVHSSVAWLALALLFSWLLPPAARALLEVQLVTVIVQWILGGALVVDLVNALAGHRSGDLHDVEDTAALRLKSLRLVGRVVVVFGLILAIGSRLVGEGTIYRWVLSTCWFASLPVALILVRWWKSIVFKRADRARKKSRIEAWILANQTGWKSSLAAIVGVAYVFGRGAIRWFRGWVGRFGITRRVLAYLFRRELDKLSAERVEHASGPLAEEIFAALGPDAPCAEWVSTDVDEKIAALFERLRARKGGVVAIVGQRGQGKTALLRRICEAFPDTTSIQLPTEGANGLASALAAELGIDPSTSLADAAALHAASETSRALVIDDVHRLIQPVMGGLAPFDALLKVASQSSAGTVWILALDDIIWLFLQRARGGRPLFDEVIRLSRWREEQIIELLEARTASVGVDPTFERLLERLPPNADEIDKREALELRARNYYRLLWDYSAGNPGVALHMWRRSLGADPDGGIHVRFFQAPDTLDLDRLPDPTIFVLRAVLQLAPTLPEEIGRATMLSAADVADALRYGVARGYLRLEDGRYTTTWAWFRPIVLFLQRRHLLSPPT